MNTIFTLGLFKGISGTGRWFPCGQWATTPLQWSIPSWTLIKLEADGRGCCREKTKLRCVEFCDAGYHHVHELVMAKVYRMGRRSALVPSHLEPELQNATVSCFFHPFLNAHAVAYFQSVSQGTKSCKPSTVNLSVSCNNQMWHC